MTILNYLIGTLGILAALAGVVILFRPSFGRSFFGDWYTPKLNLVRIVVSAFLLASGVMLDSAMVLGAGAFFTIATLFYGVMTVWQPGHEFVQNHLVESKSGMRTYVVFIILPMASLMIAGAILT